MSTLFLLLVLSVPSQAQSRRDVVLTTETTAEYFEPLTPWMPSIHTGSGVQAFVYLLEKTGNFRVRMGVQTANVNQAPNTPASLTSQATFVSTVGPASGLLYRFNPNGATDGNITAAASYRIGLLYSLSAAGSGSGSVRIESLAYE